MPSDTPVTPPRAASSQPGQADVAEASRPTPAPARKGISPLALIERERQVLSAIATGAPLKQVLEGLLLAIEAESGGGMMTSVLIRSEDGRRLCHGAAPSLPEAYNRAIDGIPIGVGIGSCGTAATTGRPVYVSDIATDPLWTDFRELALGFGLRACWSAPIEATDGAVLGTFAVYYDEPRAPAERDINAIAFVARTAALAIERHRADLKLKRSQDDLRAINADLERQVRARSQERDQTWKLSRDLLAVTTVDGTFEAINPAWTSVLGWTPDDLIGTTFVPLLHPDDLETAAHVFAGIALNPLTIPYECRLRHIDGSYRWIAWTGTCEDARIYGSGRDITHDREREAVLRDTQDFSRLALSAVGGVGVWTYEVARDLFFYDAVIADLYAIDPARGAGGIPRMDFLANMHPDDRTNLRATMSGGLARAGDLELEYRLVQPDGRIRWVLSRGHTYHDAAGIAVRRTGVGVETTNQREIEEALRQSQKMEAIGQLTGGVAHDFNNLLTVIRASTELLKRPNLTEERRDRFIGAISDTVDRAARLTGQLLAFARRQALQPETFAACDSVRGIVDMLGTLTGGRIEIVTQLPDAKCWINADPSQFDTALVNMAANARDAMGGEGRLTIRVAPVETVPALRAHPAVPGRYVAVSITDTGSGIPVERLEKIFEPFFTTKDVGQGTGLGLSQVIGFARQSGGEVRVSSEVGSGTVFTLYLPRVTHDDSAEPVLDEPEPIEDGHGARVLVVEDNAEVGTFATQTLIELGFLPVLARGATEALATLPGDATQFDVVFTDVVMPGMNGVEFAREIRRLYPCLPVVLTSGYSHVLARNGTYGFELLHKPYAIDELSRALRRALAARRTP